MKELLKKFIPRWLLFFYHGIWAYIASLVSGFPSKKLVVIGVTGTRGKSTTTNLIAAGLKAAGKTTASMSTVSFVIGDVYTVNAMHMTTPGRGFMAKFLKKAVDAGCEYAVLEVSSEGLMQNRHWGTFFDAAVFTNLTPEHILAHGSFENYKSDKKTLFDILSAHKPKKLNGQTVPTVAAVNADSEHADFFLDNEAGTKITFGTKDSSFSYKHLKAKNINVQSTGVSYELDGQKINLKLKGRFDVYNSLAALAVLEGLQIPRAEAIRGVEALEGVPGRLEVVQEEPFIALVDFAHDPESFKKLFETLAEWKVSGRIIHIFGSAGGGRDISKRPVLGEISAKNADITIVTTEDSYDDDPWEIIEQIAQGAAAAGKETEKNLFKVLDRREAIAKAVQMARPDDMVLLTGKGAEQTIATHKGKFEWDDRSVIREELQRIQKAK